MQLSDSLIHTKFHIPSIRPCLVNRSRLQEQIMQGLRGPLTLVVAPAGFGKTTLVASCVSSCAMPVAWLSLDKDDNQDARFLHYVLASLQQMNSTIGNGAAQILEAQQAPPEAVLTSLINDLDSASHEIGLVLDDYQFINSQAIHEQVTFLLERCPKTFHLVIATRSDPPLPLARLRAGGQIVELRAADLSFTETEAAQFLNDIMGLRLENKSITALSERTEGWIVGLQMAALSMRHREDIDGFIKGFSGTNRYILDYLVEEVLASQPPGIQRFLLYTSILERLSASLCDAVISASPSAGMAYDQEMNGEVDHESSDAEYFVAGESASMLEYLERANLFLVTLDDERQWYRYHHLFADLLRTQLQRSLGAQGIAHLHIRAADWYGTHGSLLDAIHHASMASDEDRLERFIGQHYMELVSHGEQSWLRSWTGQLGRDLILRRPWLCIYEAYSHSWFGELDQADLFLDAAEKRVRPDSSHLDAPAMLGHLTYIRSRVTAMRGDLPRAIEFNRAAREYFADTNFALQLDMNITLGYLYFLNGDDAHASQFLNEVIRSGRAVGAILNPVAASCLMARSHANRGSLHQAYDVYLQAAQWIDETGAQHRGASSLIEIGMADIVCEWNDLNSALNHVNEGLSRIHLWGKADDIVLAYVTTARITLAQGNLSAAKEALDKASGVVRTSGVFPEAPRAVELAQVKFWLSQGDIQEASRWAASLEQRLGSDEPIQFENELTHIAQARVLIAQNKLDKAIKLLSQVEEIARSAGRMGRVIEILLLKALAFRKKGDSEDSFVTLSKCLSLAEPEGYVRIFLDERQSMHSLIAQWLKHSASGRLRDYATHLLAQFDAAPRAVTSQIETARTPGLLEPLSQRELEVLRLMALGKINQEIARQLVVAPGTIKAHAASIYRKLNVANRTEAVTRARQLGILF